MSAICNVQFDVAARVYEILAQHSQMTADRIDADTPLESAGIDSLGMIETLFDLESTFDIKIPDTGVATDRFCHFRTAGSTVKLIESLVAEKASANGIVSMA